MSEIPKADIIWDKFWIQNGNYWNLTLDGICLEVTKYGGKLQMGPFMYVDGYLARVFGARGLIKLEAKEYKTSLEEAKNEALRLIIEYEGISRKIADDLLNLINRIDILR